MTQVRLMTIPEVAHALRLSKMTVYRMIKAGEIPFVRLGRQYRVRETDVDDLLTPHPRSVTA